MLVDMIAADEYNRLIGLWLSKTIHNNYKKLFMQPVTINKKTTCATYAFARAGYSLPDHVFAANIETVCKLVPFSEEVVPGDILMWTYNEERIMIPDSITQDGKIVSHEMLVGRHLGVYEGEGVISDVTRKNTPFSNVVIRMRHINDVHKPDYILQPNKELLYETYKVQNVNLGEQETKEDNWLLRNIPNGGIQYKDIGTEILAFVDFFDSEGKTIQRIIGGVSGNCAMAVSRLVIELDRPENIQFISLISNARKTSDL